MKRSKKFAIASICGAFCLLISVLGKQEQIGIVIIAAITLILSVISIFESAKDKQGNVLAYISLIYAFVCLIVQMNIK